MRIFEIHINKVTYNKVTFFGATTLDRIAGMLDDVCLTVFCKKNVLISIKDKNVT